MMRVSPSSASVPYTLYTSASIMSGAISSSGTSGAVSSAPTVPSSVMITPALAALGLPAASVESAVNVLVVSWFNVTITAQLVWPTGTIAVPARAAPLYTETVGVVSLGVSAPAVPAMVYESEFTVAVPVEIEGTGGAMMSGDGASVSNVPSTETPSLESASLERTRKWYVVPAVSPVSVTECDVLSAEPSTAESAP